MDEGDKMIISGFLEENWEQFKSYLEERGEDEETADNLLERLT